VTTTAYFGTVNIPVWSVIPAKWSFEVSREGTLVDWRVKCDCRGFIRTKQSNTYTVFSKWPPRSLELAAAVFFSPLLCSLKFNPLNAKLNPVCHLVALLGAHLIFHVSSIRVNVCWDKCLEHPHRTEHCVAAVCKDVLQWLTSSASSEARLQKWLFRSPRKFRF
jgi:hypothetical protein